MNNYQLPPSITIDQDVYERWLDRKAKSIVRRGKAKDGVNHGELKVYKQAVHQAVCASGGNDFYTGEKLDWSLLSKFNNKNAQNGGSGYMKQFSLLPTVDHYDSRKRLNFVICSWIVNDAKSHMSHKEFLELCHKVIVYHEGLK